MQYFSLSSTFRKISTFFLKCSRSFFYYLSCKTEPTINTNSLLSLDDDLNLNDSEDEAATRYAAFI